MPTDDPIGSGAGGHSGSGSGTPGGAGGTPRGTGSAAALEATGLHKSFSGPEGGVQVLDGLSLTVSRGEFVSIVGPSGCGKSTLLSILAGVEAPDSGSITVAGEALAPGSRPFAWMPQDDALFEWRTVLGNVSLGAEVAAGLPRPEARKLARSLLDQFGLDGFADARPSQLSGGMRQRVALARTVAMGRDCLLLDEPFGALDALTRTGLHLWLEELRSTRPWTVVLVTHDVREAVLLSDRVIVLDTRPASVVLEREIALPRTRTLGLLSDPIAAAHEIAILDALGIGGREGEASPRGAGPD